VTLYFVLIKPIAFLKSRIIFIEKCSAKLNLLFSIKQCGKTVESFGNLADVFTEIRYQKKTAISHIFCDSRKG